jgi:hypothetical protein
MKLFMFVMFAALLLVGMNTASAQIPQPIPITANVSAAPLAITPGDLTLDALQAGTTYTAIPDGAGSLALTPNDGVASVSSATETNILGDINASILVSFVLPTRLYNSGAASGYVLIRFNNTSAAWGATGVENNYFDPNVPTVMNLDNSGNVFISLGAIVTVPPNTGTDAYVGEALVTAQYTGL